MKKSVGLSAMAALVFLAVAGPASAQNVFVLGGAGFPTGDFDRAADVGWMAGGGFTFDVGDDGLWIGAEGFYGSNSHTDSDDKTNVAGAFGELGFSFHDPGQAGLYAFGGAGWVANQFSPDQGDEVNENQLGFIVGVGYDFPLGGATGFIEGRYIDTDEDNTSLGGLVAGISFGLGG